MPEKAIQYYRDITKGPDHYQVLLRLIHHDVVSFERGGKASLIGTPDRVGWRKDPSATSFVFTTVPALLLPLDKPVLVWVGVKRHSINIVWVHLKGDGEGPPTTWEEGSELDLIKRRPRA